MTLRSASLVAFVPSLDLERSRLFYADVLGLAVLELTPYALVVESGGTTIRVTRVDELRPQPFTVLGWEVADIRARSAGLAARGVELIRYEGMGQDEHGVWAAPGGARVAWFRDPDGNVLSLTQLP